MAINFPINPQINDVFIVGSKSWSWNGYAWDLVVANTSTLTLNIQSAFEAANNANMDADSAFFVANNAPKAWNSANNAYTNANTGILYAQSAFNKANSAGNDAVNSYTQANTALNNALGAFTAANNEPIAKSAFAQANTALNNALGSFNKANSAGNDAVNAYIQANTALNNALSAFNSANNANLDADSAFNKANSAGNDAVNSFIRANTGVNNSLSAFIQANTAYNTANIGVNNSLSAFIQANTALNNALGSFNKANSAGNDAVNAFIRANTAINNALGAFNLANNANLDADSAFNKANSAGNDAVNAYIQANTGVNNSLSAFIQANTTYNTANIGVNNSLSAFTQANTALNNALGAFNKANSAGNDAVNSFSRANTSLNNALGAFNQANSAGNDAVNSFSRANTALNNALGAFNQANTALNNALGAFNKANSAGNDAVNAYIKANTVTNYLPLSGGTLTGRVVQSSSGFVPASKDIIYTRIDSGFWQTSNANISTGWPETTSSWYHLLTSTHSNDGNYYSMQFAGNFYNSNSIYYRATNGDGNTTWHKIWHSGNDGSGSSLDADFLDGQQGSYYTGLSDTSTLYAQSAFNKANSAGNDAVNAFIRANTAINNALGAFNLANNANLDADSAFNKANSAGNDAVNAFIRANTAINNALGAFNLANTALTTSNYTSYAAQGVGSVGTSDLNTITISGMYRFDVPSANGPGVNYGQMLVMHGAGDTITQIVGDYSSGSLYTRSGNPPNVSGAGSWSSWRRVLDAVNYTSYVIPSTGGTFSGPLIISTSSSSDALRITQTGSGNALVVEDSSNPDSSPFIISNAGSVLSGTTTKRSVGDGFQTVVSNDIFIEHDSNGLTPFTAVLNRNDTNGLRFIFGKSRGTTVGSNTIVQNNDSLGELIWAGADGTSLTSVAAKIGAEVDGTPGTNNMPGRLVFRTTANGSSTPTERMRIDSTGNTGIGTTSPSTWGKFAVVGTNSGGAVVAAIVNSSGTANTQSVLSFDTTNNGFNVRDSQIRATNNGSNQTTLEFYTSNAGTPTEKVRINNLGNVGIGTSSPAYKLDVAGTANTGALTVSSLNITGPSANQIFYEGTSGITSFIAAPTQNNTFLNYQTGTGFSWQLANSASVGSANVSAYQTVTNATTGTWYPALYNGTSGNRQVNANNALSFNSATGALSATSFNASGITQSTFTDSSGVSTSNQTLKIGNGTNWLAFQANASGGSYNGITTTGDVALWFSNGSGTSSSTPGNLIIAPWAGFNFGLRLNSAANTVAITGSITSTANITASSGTVTASSFSGAGTGLTGTASSLTAGLATNIVGGDANRIPYQTGTNTTGFITAPTQNNTFLNYTTGGGFSWQLANGASVGSANVSAYQTVTNATTGTYYPALYDGTSGNRQVYANSAFVFNVSTGQMGIGGAPSGSVGRLIVSESITPLGANTGAYIPISTELHSAGSNFVYNTRWRLRKANTSTSWTTQALHDGVWVDASFTIPGSTTKTWWERYPNQGSQSWGDGATTGMTLSSAGALTTTSSVTASSFSGAGTGLTGTASSLNIGGNAGGNATSSRSVGGWDGTSYRSPGFVMGTSGGRTVDLTPNTYSYGLTTEFKSSSTFSSTGNYSGLITYAPWDSTTASTGDPSYQLLFSPSAANSTTNPVLKLRAGINTTWGSWNTILHSGNYSNYIVSTFNKANSAGNDAVNSFIIANTAINNALGAFNKANSGPTLTDDTSTNANRPLVFTSNTNGQAFNSVFINSTELYTNPSTGTLFATIFSSLSDESQKDNISPLQNSSEIVNKMNPVSFNWKKTGKKSYGVIAQEIEKILPDIVHENDGIKSVEYDSLIAFLIKSIQELSEDLNETKSRLLELEKNNINN